MSDNVTNITNKTEEFIKYERANLKKKTFSITTFVNLMQTYLNDPEFTSHVMKVKEGKAHKLLDYPVKKFRKVLYNVIVDFGVDKKDAEAIMDSYQFKSKDLEGMYSFLSDFMYQYLKTGRRFTLFEKEDLVASIIADDVEEDIKEFKLSKNPIKFGKHKKLKVSSSCPKWEKQILSEDRKKVLKVMEKVAESI